ncbi:unnamed protein product [Clavelina lepadiformis]|uniref:Helicase ATP-binding domain-containing protein n=1 Tax=Clavelina lepadiformis TaxID=159417 RepID=A0ABP0H1F7_CLALP
MASSEKELMISGVKVCFPCKPYPSQLSMMNKIIKGLEQQQHCLLESPTGSGKSLALLCSALAWQKNMTQRVMDEAAANEKKEARTDSLESNGEDFEKNSTSNSKVKSLNEIEKKLKVPKIWFGTRTHKQIAQITHELARTAYKTTNMTILSSREHSCIHPFNKESRNKNDGCRDLVKGKHEELPGSHCVYYQNVHRMKTHSSLYSCGITTAWDLEELVTLGNRIKACPYYSTRELISSASIIFCPYNYLIDPSIRAQMSINLKDQVVIVDEAHNIEDTSREAAGFTVEESELVNTIADLDHMIVDKIKPEQHEALHLLCTKIGQWLHKCSSSLKETSHDTWTKVWAGMEFISHLSDWGITDGTLPEIKRFFQEVMETDEEEEEHPAASVLHTASQSLIGGLLHVLEYLMYDSHRFIKDYRIAVIRSAQYGVPPPKRTREGWIAINKRSMRYYTVNLHFWCLNPAVAFSDLSSARSIVLTSGTLSPMSSFSSELGLSFPIQLEASHVISDSQVWVGSVGAGPTGHTLQATYQNTSALQFQDELGQLVNEVCRIVPHGVLCFFSSYSLLEKLSERWRCTGLWDSISERKVIFCEPHGRNKAEFEETLKKFYEVVSSERTNGVTGPLLLAVCRGKVSEGLDFSDNNARAVITVGIPFPNYKDRQVELKREYNDQNSKSRGLLSGSEWYEIQAFRALNQALGRCIRHRNDWGALIIVDDRFCKNPKRYCKGLSKWVRQKVLRFWSFQTVQESLETFCNVHKSGVAGTLPISLNGDISISCTNNIVIDVESPCCSSYVASDSRIKSFVDTPKVSKTNHACKSKEKSKSITTEFVKSSFPLKTFSTSSNKEVIVLDELNDPKRKTLTAGTFESDVDDVVFISSTPKKKQSTIIIPESPEDSVEVDDDFRPLTLCSTKRKSYPGRSKKTIAQQLAKKYKQAMEEGSDNPNLSDTSKNDVKDVDVSVAAESSYKEEVQLLKPKTRRRKKLKSSPKTSKKQNSRKTVTCTLCHEKLFSREEDLKLCATSFYYIQKKFPNENIFTLDGLCDDDMVEKISYHSQDVFLDTFWCNNDKLAFQFYQCKDCKTCIGFYVLNNNCSTFYVISSKVNM